MIYKRAVAKLRAQDWFAISIELAIVVLGVFIGTWVADWNQQRLQKREVVGLVERLRPTLKDLDAQIADDVVYYATTRRYALTALAGLQRDPRVTDQEFVIASYEASQVTGFGANSQIFSTLIGADQVRQVPDPALRTAIGRVLGADFTSFRYDSMLTDYRKTVRELIPNSVQERIRESCDDSRMPSQALHLPPQCQIDLPVDEVAHAVASLRSHPELVRQLDYHLAEGATFVGNLTRYDENVRRLLAMIDQKAR